MEPSRLKAGDHVRLRRGAIPTLPLMRVVQIDEAAQKAQIRFSPTTGHGYSYLFWRDLSDIEEVEVYGRPSTEV